MKHLIDIKDLSTNEIEELINIAKDIMGNKEKYAKKCEGKKIATLFYEPSTRTRLSFEAAMLELGGNVLGFSSANSSFNCFNTFLDTYHNIIMSSALLIYDEIPYKPKKKTSVKKMIKILESLEDNKED